MRRLFSGLLFKLARWSQQVSMFFGGISALGFVIALIMLVFNHKHGAAHYGEFTVRRWLWMFPSIALAAWLIGFRWLPSLLAYFAVAAGERCRSRPRPLVGVVPRLRKSQIAVLALVLL